MSNLLSQASLVMIPSGYKEDVVYSQIPTDGSGDMTFTRASDGTRINSAGLVEVVPWNMVSYSEDLANGAWSSQGSTISSNSTTAPNGTTTADTLIETNTTDEHNRYQEITTLGQNTFSVYLKKFNADWCALYVFNPSIGGIRYWVNVNTLTAGTSANIGGGIGTTSLSLESVGNGWVRASITFNNPSGACRYYVANAQSNGGATTYAGNGTSGVYAWGAQLNIGSTAKPYFPTTDRLNVPRLTYQNGGGGCPSLLLEKQSTNLVTYSEAFDNAAWTASASNATVTANTTVSPDGTQNADTVVFGSGGYLYQGVTISLLSSATFSIFAKTTTQTIIFGGASPNGTDVYSYQDMGNGWYRQILTRTFTTGGTGLLQTLVYANNVTRYIYGAQLEASSYATSYIPSQGSSVTRLADAIPSKSTLLSDKNNYSMFLDVYPKAIPLFRYFFIQKNSSDNAEIIWGGSSGGTDFAIYDYTVSQSVWVGNINDGNRHKICLSVASGKIDLFVDGVQVVTQKSTSQTGFYYVAFDGNPGIYKINELVIMSKITDADAIALTTL